MSVVAKGTDLGAGLPGCQLALPVTSRVILCKLLNLSVPQFLHLENGVSSSSSLQELSESGLNW